MLVLPVVGCGSSSAISDGAAASSQTTPATTVPPATPAVTAVPTPTTAVPATPTAAVPAAVKKSISGWVSCSGTADDTEGVTRAMAAASHSAFTLVVDCPVRLHIGTDIARTIFIDDGTTVQFTGSGKFTVDNVLLPAFVIANSSNITLTDWNVEYDAGLPVNPNVGGYENNGARVAEEGSTQPANASNDLRITPWLAANRAITFDRSQGGVNSIWAGPTNASAVFFLTGDTFNVTVSGMQLYVPATAGGNQFIPVAFSLSQNYKSNQTVTAKTPITSQYVAIPHALRFMDITLDGTYMGWQGNASNVYFSDIQSHRYGDLQDANGGNVGGIGDWFAPPHLFYLNYVTAGDPALFTKNVQITDVVDDGPRIGTARSTASGSAMSLKIGCVGCSVDNYQSSRPDGFMDVLASDGLTISNVTATYDSAFESNRWPGWRFPSSGYTNVTFENIVLTDSAPTTSQPPIGSANQISNSNIVFSNVKVKMNGWSGTERLPLPSIAGTTNNVSLSYVIADDTARVLAAQQGTGSLTLLATPTSLSAGGSTTLTWTSKDVTGCTAGGSWSGAVGTGGSRVITLSAPGTYNFVLTCQSASSTSSTTMPVIVQ
jgi:hypothetical protein